MKEITGLKKTARQQGRKYGHRFANWRSLVWLTNEGERIAESYCLNCGRRIVVDVTPGRAQPIYGAAHFEKCAKAAPVLKIKEPV